MSHLYWLQRCPIAKIYLYTLGHVYSLAHNFLSEIVLNVLPKCGRNLGRGGSKQLESDVAN